MWFRRLKPEVWWLIFYCQYDW